MILYRRADPHEIETIMSLVVRTFTGEQGIPEEMNYLPPEKEPRWYCAAEDGRIIGCASLCVSHTPTGTKGGIEDVVVGSAFRGRHIGRMLMEHIIEYARREFSPIELHLTSRPAREAANLLYQSLGFYRYETNYYKMNITG